MTHARTALARWTRSYNRRRLFEQLLRGLAWGACGAAATILATKVTDSTQVIAAMAAASAVAGSIVAVAGYRGARTTPARLAAAIDRRLGESDLLQTALAVENAQCPAPTSADLRAIVEARAAAVVPTLDDTAVDPFRPAAQLLAAAAVALITSAGVVWYAPDIPPRAEAAEPLPELDPETRERLEEAEAALEDLANTPGLNKDVKERVEAARRGLEAARKAGTPGERVLGALSRANRVLDDAEQKSRDGQLIDPAALQDMSNDELAKHMMDAFDRGDQAMADAAASEMMRRAESGQSQPWDLGASLAKAVSEMPDKPQGKSGLSSEDRHEMRDSAVEAARRLLDGQTGSAESKLSDMRRRLRRKMAERGASPSTPRHEAMRRARKSLSRARAKQLARMNGADREGRRGERRLGRRGERRGDPHAGHDHGPQGECLGPDGKPVEMAGREGSGREGREGSGREGSGEGREGRGEGREGRGEGREGRGEGREGRCEGREGSRPGEGRGDGTRTTTASSESRAGGPFGTGPHSGRRTGEGSLLSRTYEQRTEQVDVGADRPPEGTMRVIRASALGHRGTEEYRDLHERYSEVAESSIDQQAIPLTRRDYIRDYFDALRPK